MTIALGRGLVGLIVLFWLTTGVQAQSVIVEGNVESQVSSSQSSVIASPLEVPPDGIAYSTVVITARNSNGDPLPNKSVTVTASDPAVKVSCEGDDADGSDLGTTDSNGQLICLIRSTETLKISVVVVVDTVTLDDQPVITFVYGRTGGSTGGTSRPPPTGGGGTEPPVDPPIQGEEPPTTIPPPGQDPPPLTPSSEPTQLLERVIESVGQAINTIAEALPKNSPAIVGLATIIPTIAVLAPITTSISIALLGGAPALQYLFYSLLPFFRSPRRWGIVSDAQTNTPIPGVFVSLHDLKTGRELRRVLTDKTGRYGFLAEPHGQYWVEISSPLYQPYRSGIIDGTQLAQGTLSYDIHLTVNPELQITALRKVAHFSNWVRIVQGLQMLVLVAGSLMALVLIIQAVTIETILLVALYALLWALRSVSFVRAKKFGLVKDRALDTGLGDVVLQVTSEIGTDRSFVHSTISDEAGRFILLVPPGKYTLIGAKQGYHPVEKKIAGEAEDTLLALQRVGLQPRPELTVY